MPNFTLFSINFKTLLLLILLIYINNIYEAYCWNGFDFDSNSNITIDIGNTVRSGYNIQFFDSSTNNYRSAQIISVRQIFNDTEVVVLDLDSNKERTFIMN